MGYRVIWDEQAVADLKKLDRSIAKRIIQKVETHLAINPLEIGYPLSRELSGFYKYRVADDWRVVYLVREQEIIIEVIRVGHRSKVYKNKS